MDNKEWPKYYKRSLCRTKQAHRLYHAIKEECPCQRASKQKDWEAIYSDERKLAALNAMALRSRT